MIPTFPTFTNLSIDHKKQIDEITHRYKPYSDFDFVSLYSWNTDMTTKVSLINGNLAVSLPDYITNETTYSVIGDNLIDETLLELSKVTKRLSFVPEETVAKIRNPEKYKIHYDRTNYDYIFSIKEHAELPGKAFKGKRKRYSKIDRELKNRCEISHIDFDDDKCKAEVIGVFKKWATEKERTHADVANEECAIKRALDCGKQLGLTGLLIKIDDVPVGFSVIEELPNKFGVYHFQKCTLAYPNIDIYLTSIQSKELYEHGIEFVNWEQDLGIEGLRKLKDSYFTYDFLRKFTIDF